MAQIKQINILDMIKIYGEEDCRSILSSFICPPNKDVENFIHNKSIEFALQHIAITFLVFLENRKQLLFVGYYTLANKFVSISGNTLSKTMQKRISKFSQYDTNSRSYLISMPLIAQLGKNFAYENVNIINFYEEPELPIKLEDLKNDNKYLVDLENLQNKVIEGVFTLEEYKDMKKLLQNIEK